MTVYSGAPGGHTTKGTKAAKKSNIDPGTGRFAHSQAKSETAAFGHYAYDDADNMLQKLRWNVPSSTLDEWLYGCNNGNEQTSMTLNAGTPETRTYDAWGRLAARAQGGYAAEYGYRYGSRLHEAASSFPGARV